MSKRISKRVREEAALALSILASDPSAGRTMFIGTVLERGPAHDLALLAFRRVIDHDVHLPWSVTYAEAEALIRDGWSP